MDNVNTYKVNKEAVKKIAEKVYDNGSTVINRNDLEEMFPELKESEDERIRKALIEHFKWNVQQILYDFDNKQVLAWLEKQGEHANFRNKIQIGDKVTRNEDGVLVNLSQLKRVAKKDEKQGEQKSVEKYNITGIGSKHAEGKLGEMIKNLKPLEQKPVVKAEPKFKVGDWITDGNITIQIEAIKNDCYLYCGDCALYSTKTADKVYHLWTIQDAKDGDVLYAKGSYFKEYLFMFSSFTEDNVISTHFGYDTFHGTFDKKLTRFGREEDFMSIIPATKEQCDLLFSKMKEAGYVWDAEKKELKITNWSKHIKYEPNSPSITKEKSVWSEEDEMFVHGLIRGLAAKRDIHGHTTFSSDCIDITETINWLKSLKDRYTWKPSEEQMKALNTCIMQGEISYVGQGTELQSLYNDLKKLTE